ISNRELAWRKHLCLPRPKSWGMLALRIETRNTAPCVPKSLDVASANACATRTLGGFMIHTCLVLLLTAAAAAQDHRGGRDYGGSSDSSKYVALNQINKSNVNRLEVAWSYPTYDGNAYLFNPLVIDHVMYLLARNSSLVALDATTGKEIWIHENL